MQKCSHPSGTTSKRGSRISQTRQPWEDDVTAAPNEATFLQASAAIATCITRASGRPAPHGDRGQQQLHRLVLDWRIHSRPVLTFNYDLLVERVVEEWDPSVTGSDLYPVPLVERDAVGAAARTGYAEARQPSFELYKLPGSINWFHSPSNSTGPITVPAVILAAPTSHCAHAAESAGRENHAGWRHDSGATSSPSRSLAGRPMDRLVGWLARRLRLPSGGIVSRFTSGSGISVHSPTPDAGSWSEHGGAAQRFLQRCAASAVRCFTGQ
jgi:hypothetical protein